MSPPSRESIGRSRRKASLGVVLIALAALVSGTAAGAYPERPIRLIVAFPAGTTLDLVARVVGDKLETALGKPVVIDNRPGASGSIGFELAAKAPADGYTLAIVGLTLVTLPVTSGSRTVDPLRDFTPIVKLATQPAIVLAHPSLKVDSLQELIAEARRRPGGLAYSTVGIGASTQLAAELLFRRAGVKLLYIPYSNSSFALKDLLAGEVQLSFTYPTGKEKFVRAGQLKALAVTSSHRLALMPEVPTIEECGFPDFDVSSWFGMVAPAGTPRDVVDRLNAEFLRILESPEVRATFARQGLEAEGGTAEQFGEYIAAEHRRWAPVVKALGIKLE
jgi:tripartite-type tricarboxylate transporter receptor subunit TctC